MQQAGSAEAFWAEVSSHGETPLIECPLFSIHDPLTLWDIEGLERKKRYAGLRADRPQGGGHFFLSGVPTDSAW